MNRGQIRTRIIQTLGLDETVDGEEYDLINDLINEGIVDILARTKLNSRCVNITIPADEREVQVSSAILHMDGLYDSNEALMRQIPQDEARANPDPGVFALVGFNTLVLGGDASAERVYGAWYIARPTPMDDDAQDPSDPTFGGIPPEFHTVIVNYCLWHGANYGDDITSQSGERYRLMYEGQDGLTGNLGRIKRLTNRRIMPAGRRRRIRDSYRSTTYY
jgi:hypothetical protein